MKTVLSELDLTGKLKKRAKELGVYDTQIKPRTSKNGQVLADFIYECTKLGNTELEAEEQEEETWELYVDGASNQYGAGI